MRAWIPLVALLALACAPEKPAESPCPAEQPAEPAPAPTPASMSTCASTSTPSALPNDTPPPNHDGTPSQGTGTSAPVETTRPPLPRSAEDQKAFNDWAKKSPWAGKLPELVAQAFADTEVQKLTLSIEYEGGEGATSAKGATVIAVVDGYLDDSVRGAEHTLKFSVENGTWKLTGANQKIRCWPGRGHEEFSAEACK